MALLLDTDTLDRRDRAEAVVAAMRQAQVPAELTHEPDAADVQARVELWELGGGVSLLHRTSTGIRLRRTPALIRSTAADRVSLTLLGPGRWRFRQREVDRVERSAGWEAILVDQSAPYEFARLGTGSTYAFGIDHRALGLPVDTVRAAAGRLPASPLYRLVTQHVRDVARVVDEIPPGPATTTLGTATGELVRALLLTAVAGAAALGPDTLLTRTRLYVQRHLTEPDLSPERIARAHHVSLRQLYNIWAGADESLAGHIIAQRLALARRMLSGSGTRTVAAVGRSCGFADAAHFARRFRDAYGMSPREWRERTRP